MMIIDACLHIYDYICTYLHIIYNITTNKIEHVTSFGCLGSGSLDWFVLWSLFVRPVGPTCVLQIVWFMYRTDVKANDFPRNAAFPSNELCFAMLKICHIVAGWMRWGPGANKFNWRKLQTLSILKYWYVCFCMIFLLTIHLIADY